MDCIFCKIAAGEIPSTKVYENELVYAFDDISPQAPVHVLVIPKQHLGDLNDINDAELWTALLDAARTVAEIKGVKQTGYRLVVNCGTEGGQVVQHLHLHVLGGQKLADQMG